MAENGNRAYEIARPRVFANFRQTRAERAKQPKLSWRATRTGMSEEHLSLIRQLPCTLGPERYRVECHHLKDGPARRTRGFGFTSLDCWVVPLFWLRHTELENISSRRELAFFMERGINPYDLAEALWLNTGDLDRMSNVLKTHKQSAIRTLNAARRGA